MIHSLLKKEAGFTIVELTVVIIIVSILVVIGSVSYIAIQSSAKLQDVREDLNNFSRTLTDYKAKNSAYPIQATILSGPYSVSVKKRLYSEAVPANVVYCTDTNYGSYALLAITKDNKKVYVTNTATAQEYKGAVAWQNGDRNAMCQSVLPGSVPRGSSGFQSGVWQSWIAAS